MAERHQSDAPRDDLVRSVPFTLDRDAAASGPLDGRTLSGHGTVFNQWTEISSAWEGTFRERIAPGAFKKTLRENAGRVRLQFDHGQHPLIGSLPIGNITDLREDAVGLAVQARLADNWLVEPVRDAVASGAIDGMSFRFSVEKETWTDGADGMPERTITEVRLMELGPVVWPAYAGTDVGVRSAAPQVVGIAHKILTADPETRSELARLLSTAGAPEPEQRQDAATEPSGADLRTWYSDLREQLDNELDELFPSADETTNAYLWVRDFNESQVIFELQGFAGFDDGTYSLDYSIDDNGAVILSTDDPQPVIVQTTYVPEPPDGDAGRSTGTPQGEAAGDAGTSTEGAADSAQRADDEPLEDEHSEASPYTPATRAPKSAERRKRDRDEIAAWLAA